MVVVIDSLTHVFTYSIIIIIMPACVVPLHDAHSLLPTPSHVSLVMMMSGI